MVVAVPVPAAHFTSTVPPTIAAPVAAVPLMLSDAGGGGVTAVLSLPPPPQAVNKAAWIAVVAKINFFMNRVLCCMGLGHRSMPRRKGTWRARGAVSTIRPMHGLLRGVDVK
jgi:hypothetical protein